MYIYFICVYILCLLIIRTNYAALILAFNHFNLVAGTNGIPKNTSIYSTYWKSSVQIENIEN